MKTMKTYPFTAGLATLLTAGLLIFSSCKKKEETPDPEPEPPDTEQNTANDNNTAEFVAADIETIGSQASENGELTTYKTSSGGGVFTLGEVAGCAVVTWSPATRSATVDFGTSCVGLDGRTRSGKLVYDFSVSSPTTAIYYRNPGFKYTVTSHNYVVENHTVNINNKTITNTTPLTIPTGTNPGTNLTWAIAANISIIKPNGQGTITWTCNRTKELINTSDPNCYRGQATHILWTNARVMISGSASGTNYKGE